MTNGNSCRETLEGELTNDIHIDTSAIPESVRHRLCALTLERFNAYEYYNYDGFKSAYETIIRQTSALNSGPRKAVGPGMKQIGGKT